MCVCALSVERPRRRLAAKCSAILELQGNPCTAAGAEAAEAIRRACAPRQEAMGEMFRLALS